MTADTVPLHITIGVLALQGAFNEHTQLLRRASQHLPHTVSSRPISWTFLEVKTVPSLSACDALIIPGGESTAISLVAERSGLLQPLREFVKLHRKPVWGTCAGLILLSEAANRSKKGGQELIGGLDVRVNRNHFGRQTESFQSDLDLPFLDEDPANNHEPFKAIFIRAPVVEKVLPATAGPQVAESEQPETVVAPSLEQGRDKHPEVEILGRIKGDDEEKGAIVAVRQANVFGTSFHPELSGDERIHVWWLGEVVKAFEGR
jgi:5'-phosphate synthase pdxT subunit